MWSGFFVLICILFLGYLFVRACDNANVADWGSCSVNRIDGFIRLFCRYMHRFQFDPLPLPAKGCALVASNHISGLDPFLLIAASSRPLRFLIAREQYERFGLTWLFRSARCIPVDREVKPESALREALVALAQGDIVAVFPQGRIHEDKTSPCRLKGGIVYLAKKAGCEIYPARVDDVRGAGLTALALIIPSRSSLRTYPVISCEELNQGDCLGKVASAIGVAHSSEK